MYRNRDLIVILGIIIPTIGTRIDGRKVLDIMNDW